jgi:hypothetical protein
VGHPKVEEGGTEVPGEEFGMDCQGMSGCEAEEEQVCGENEDEGHHGWDAGRRFSQKVEKLRD